MIIILRIFGVALLIFLFFFFHTNLGLQGKIGLLCPLRMEHRIVGGLAKMIIATNSSNTSLEVMEWKSGL